MLTARRGRDRCRWARRGRGTWTTSLHRPRPEEPRQWLRWRGSSCGGKRRLSKVTKGAPGREGSGARPSRELPGAHTHSIDRVACRVSYSICGLWAQRNMKMLTRLLNERNVNYRHSFRRHHWEEGNGDRRIFYGYYKDNDHECEGKSNQSDTLNTTENPNLVYLYCFHFTQVTN